MMMKGLVARIRIVLAKNGERKERRTAKGSRRLFIFRSPFLVWGGETPNRLEIVMKNDGDNRKSKNQKHTPSEC